MVSQVESLKMHRDPVIPLLGVPSRPGTFAHFHPTLSYQKTGYILHWTTRQQWKRQWWYRPTQSILLKERKLVAESSTCKWTTKESKGVVRSSGESRPVLLCFSMQQCNMPFPTTHTTQNAEGSSSGRRYSLEGLPRAQWRVQRGLFFYSFNSV